jgi:hypothetical protein
MGYEMYQRGIISYEQLASLLKALDYSPVWRDKLIQLAHSPYTRVDIRRMYQMGILSQEQVFRSYKDIGYDDEHATNLTIFTVTGASEEEKDLTKADIIAGYKDNILFREDAKALLMNLGYDETEAEFYLVRAEIDITTEQRKTRIDEIHTLYIKRVYLESQARNSLAQAGVSGLEANRQMEPGATNSRRTVDTCRCEGIIQTSYDVSCGHTNVSATNKLHNGKYRATISTMG